VYLEVQKSNQFPSGNGRFRVSCQPSAFGFWRNDFLLFQGFSESGLLCTENVDREVNAFSALSLKSCQKKQEIVGDA